MTVNISPRNAVVSLCTITGVIVLAYGVTLVSTYIFGHDQVRGLVPLFNLDEEGNVPTYFASALVLMCSLLALAIAKAEKNRHGPDHRYWGGVGIILLYLSVDEGAELHDRLNAVVQGHGLDPALRPFYVSWVIPYAFLVVVVGLVFIRFLRRLPAATRRLMVLSAGMYVLGSIGLEEAGGLYLVSRSCQKDLVYELLVMCEETLEMTGMIVLVYALMSYAGSFKDGFSVRISPSRNA